MGKKKPDRKKCLALKGFISPKLKRQIIFYSSGVLLFFLLLDTFALSNVSFQPPNYYFYASDSLTINKFADTLEAAGVIESSLSLRLVAEIRGLYKVKQGLYAFKRDWNNWQIVSHVGSDSPIPYVVAKVKPYRLRKNMVESICDYFPEIEKREIWSLLRDKEFLDSLGFSREAVFVMFIPGTYVLPKKMQPRQLLKEMHTAYQFFWNKERLKKAKKIGLTPEEVVILASIVYCETKNKSEMPVIAGVYINRINKKMRLQSDPTVVYASKKFGVKRVLYIHRMIKSDYNTYRHLGLPPGPIHVTPAFVIDAVLNYAHHDYLYFCAKDDFSGTHLFAESFDEHKENAQNYHASLDRLGIF